MQTRSLVAEMFFSIPTHVWVLPVAGVIAYFGLKMAESAIQRSTLLHGITYALLLALAIIPSGIYALMPPTPDMPELLSQGQSLPNYTARFYLDAFYVFAGWASAWVIRSKFGSR